MEVKAYIAMALNLVAVAVCMYFAIKCFKMRYGFWGGMVCLVLVALNLFCIGHNYYINFMQAIRYP